MPPDALLLSLAGAMLAGLTALAVFGAGAQRRRASRRMAAISASFGDLRRGGLRAMSARRGGGVAPRTPVERLVQRLQLLRSKEAESARLQLVRAGLRSDRVLSLYLFVRVGLPLLLTALVLINGHLVQVLAMNPRWIMPAAVAAAAIGFYGPSVFLKNLVTKRQALLRKSLPDGLDLLVICLEAGSSLNETCARVGRELAGSHPALAEELTITAAELSFLPERRLALDNLAERTGLDPLRSVVTTLLQAERFGTPIAQALRVLSAEFRTRRMMAAEERAAKLPVLLTVPMMVFILPVLFIVLLGPAVLSILDTFSK